MEEPILLLSGHHGVYIPKMFHDMYANAVMEKGFGPGVDKETWESLSAPDDEFYWESWEEVLDNFSIEINGKKHNLYQDDDLWLVPEGSDIEKLFV